MRMILSIAMMVTLFSVSTSAVLAGSPVSIQIVNNTKDTVHAWTAPANIQAMCSPDTIGAGKTATVVCQSDGGAFFLAVNNDPNDTPFCLVGQNGYDEHADHCTISQMGNSSYRVVLAGAHANANVDFTNVRIDVDNQTGDGLLAWTAPHGEERDCSPLPGSRIGAHQHVTAVCLSIGGHFQFAVSGYAPSDPYCIVSDTGDNDHPERCSLRKIGDLHYAFVVTGDHAY